MTSVKHFTKRSYLLVYKQNVSGIMQVLGKREGSKIALAPRRFATYGSHEAKANVNSYK
ncbi:hypothetical protein [Vibrio crassostreae]|uniref:hypothetical protein n=1 Tax=Vibrio crassostreae TaxID=246167 RepID=UPI001B30E9C3|nr:hypothetical protein [Vibrio crassostreae]